MNEKIASVVSLWREEASSHIKKYVPYRVEPQLKQMAALFSPGHFYYYVLNFHDLTMDYVHPGVNNMLGINSEDFTIFELLEHTHPADVESMGFKEALISDFFYSFLKPAELRDYKAIYFLRLKDAKGNYRKIMHQATPVTVNKEGRVEHLLCIQTDVSKLQVGHSDRVSLINLKGGTSYYNLDPTPGKFQPELAAKAANSLMDVLTTREIEVIELLARGYNAEEIGDYLGVSFNTVRTHRKNMLKKTSCANATELVARCMLEGVI